MYSDEKKLQPIKIHPIIPYITALRILKGFNNIIEIILKVTPIQPNGK